MRSGKKKEKKKGIYFNTQWRNTIATASIHREKMLINERIEKLLPWFRGRTCPVHKYTCSLNELIEQRIKLIISNARKEGRLCDNERYDLM